MEFIKKCFNVCLEFFKKGFKNLYSDVIKIRVVFILGFIIIILLAKYLYLLSIELSSLIAKIFSNTMLDNKIIQFLLIFLPIIVISYLLSKFIKKVSFRTFRFFIISLYLYVEVFIIETANLEVLNISEYIYLYITLESLIYFLLSDINRKGERNAIVQV